MLFLKKNQQCSELVDRDTPSPVLFFYFSRKLKKNTWNFHIQIVNAFGLLIAPQAKKWLICTFQMNFHCCTKDSRSWGYDLLHLIQKNNVKFFQQGFEHLEASVAFMDARNGFLTKFYIEIVIRFFSQLFFVCHKNYFWK